MASTTVFFTSSEISRMNDTTGRISRSKCCKPVCRLSLPPDSAPIGSRPFGVRPFNCSTLSLSSLHTNIDTTLCRSLASTPPGMPGTHPPIFLVGGTSTEISPQYYCVLSDIADQYWFPSIRSASSRFHAAIRRHQFASVRQADSRLTRLVPPTFNSR